MKVNDMKINPISNPNILKAYQATVPKKATPGVPGKRDEVTFSEEALSYSRAMAEAKDELEFRTPEEKAHIANVTQAVRNDEYRVDSDQIADKILESVLGRR